MATSSIDEQIQKVKDHLAANPQIDPSTRLLFDMLIMLILSLTGRLGMNSRNSSKPPSTDPNRPRTERKGSERLAGGQKGRNGVTLEPVKDPDEVIIIPVDRAQLPADQMWTEAGYGCYQVFDIRIERHVIEYRLQQLCSERGEIVKAPLPEGVKAVATQYGNSVKAMAVYGSMFQLLPYERLADQFDELYDMPLSVGSLVRFNQEAYCLLEWFEEYVTRQLQASPLIHADETGINVGGKRHWLHNASNERFTFIYPHEKRGTEAMEEMGVLPQFRGVICHDHWKPYYTYKQASHALCNAHHLRELTAVIETENHQWAKDIRELLSRANECVRENGGGLPPEPAQQWRVRYREILAGGNSECPPPQAKEQKDGEELKRGRIKRSKARNLLERLIDYEDDVLRFLENPHVPFTNNQGERDIRMTKVQQKISGCFRSTEGAKTFCRIRSYLSTCQKHDLSPATALELLFQGKKPEFMT